ncbi:mitochondrial import inner membrane translocase subunit Tim10 B isoform X1 [Sylvia atricapilla]|uniref:mitochondrial import inner membrane translocase subunit Tim10 B isoform X1 n=1 Tax=Sylvia atricapilla TaxID=48155 RepID=UPI003395A41B
MDPAAEHRQQLRSENRWVLKGPGRLGLAGDTPGLPVDFAGPGPAPPGMTRACSPAAGLPAGLQPYDRAVLPPLCLQPQLPPAHGPRGERGTGGRRSGVPTPPDPIPSPPQESCLDSCAARLVRANHRLMGAYVGLMPALLQRRAAEHGAPAGPSGLPGSPEPAPGPAESSPDAPAAGT